MKTLLVLTVVAAFVAGCKLDEGQHLGNFKNDCAAKSGVLSQAGPNEYQCKLPDGTVLKSK
jgi:hypothetical protein